MIDTVRRVASLGVAAGIRSMTPIAVLTCPAAARRLDLKNTHFSVLDRPLVGWGLGLVMVGEMAVDKLPLTPDRRYIPSLLWRMVQGGLAGALVAEESNERELPMIVVGAGAAAAGTFGGYFVRMALNRKGVPNPVSGLVGDLVAVGLSGSAVWFGPRPVRTLRGLLRRRRR